MVSICKKNSLADILISFLEFLMTDLLRSVDDSRVVTELQRADDGGAQREQEVTCHLLFLLLEIRRRRRMEKQKQKMEMSADTKGGGTKEREREKQ